MIGSTHTYLKRYCYCNALEIVEDDAINATIDKEKADSKNEKADPKKNKKEYTEKEIREKSIEIISKYEEFFKKEVNDLTEKGAFQLEDVPTDNLKKLAAFMKDKIKNDKDLQEVIRKKGA